MDDTNLASAWLGFLSKPLLAESIDHAQIPPGLPPIPPINALSLLDRLSMAERALERPAGVTTLLPRKELLV